jgi:ATP-dependent exoDNAse (exonuclease V) beta subunit
LGMDEVEIDEPVLVAQELREAASPKSADVISWVLYPPLPIGEAIALPFRFPQAEDVIPGDLVAPLVEPVAQQLDERTHARESDPPERVWRVVPKAKRPSGPAWVVGQLFHEALRRWRFPTQADALDYSWEAFMVPYALETGLVGETEIHATLQEVRRLLERFQNHPLFTEIESAERYHELPYVLASAGNLDYQRGVIDLLYRTSATNQWVIVDFKTDEVKSEAEARQLIQQAGYDQQMQRYVEAIVAWLGCRPQKKLVFLRVAGEVMVFDPN